MSTCTIIFVPSHLEIGPVVPGGGLLDTFVWFQTWRKKREISNFELSRSLTVNEHKISARPLGCWVLLAVNQRHSLKKDFLYIQNPTKPFEPRSDA